MNMTIPRNALLYQQRRLLFDINQTLARMLATDGLPGDEEHLDSLRAELAEVEEGLKK